MTNLFTAAGRRTSFLIAIVGLNLMACCCSGIGNQRKPPTVSPIAAVKPPEPIPPIKSAPSPDEFIKRFGKPDKDTIGHHPTLKVPERRLSYKAQNVCVLYVAADKENPVKSWAFHEYLQDENDKIKLKDDDVLKALALRDTEKKRIDETQAADQKRFNDAQAAAKKAIEDAKPTVTRANYNRIQTGMSFEEVNEILGKNSREHARVGESDGIVSWTNRGERNGCTITITFSNGSVAGKSIFGD